MSKNVNNEVTMNPPIQNYAYPDDHAAAAAYDRILQFPSLQSRKKQCLYTDVSNGSEIKAAVTRCSPSKFS